MSRYINFRKDSIGQSPDSIIFRGEQKVQDVCLRLISYNSSELDEITLSSVSELESNIEDDRVNWINIDGLHDISVMEDIRRLFNLDTLLISDVVNTDLRPKVYEHEGCLFISIKMLQYDDAAENEVTAENFVIILKEDAVISFQEKRGDVFEPVRERIRKQKKRIRNSGSDYLVFALLDVLIDNYIYISSRIGEKVECVEDKLLARQSNALLEEINGLKREVNFLRKSVKPGWEMILNLQKLDSSLISDNVDVHFKELQHNINQAIDIIDGYNVILMDQLNVFHATVSYKLNDIMKFLTIFSVIFIPLTFIAGLYGTNFDNIPELHYKYGYYAMLLVMLFVVLVMVYYFRKKRWFR